MKANMLDYTKKEISQLPDDSLSAEWQQYMAFSNQRQRLREDVQRMMRKKSTEHQVKADDIPDGGMATTKLGTKEILLAKVAGKLYAIDNACGHSGYPLDKGKLDGYVVTCRWHDAQFDVRSGAVLAVGREMKPINRYHVVQSDDGMVKIGEEL